ncbi:MAG TPA: hypothetical protein ENK18_02010 [Deltaproteobacteria bacterium]|nr:hypothetical protein [Deltaproteobacteria bacterium]
MDHDELEKTIETFTEARDTFAIGIEYLAAGVSSVQLFIQHVQRGTLEGPRHLPLLERAADMLERGLPKLEAQPEVAAIAEGYIALVTQLTELVGAEPSPEA